MTLPNDPLAVFQRLEIGPVQIEPRRLTAPYRLTVRDGQEPVETNLVYSYEEDVFEPGNSVSLNIAAVIAAQVAINYGLFCREMIFHGVYDLIDQRFIRDMAENTAREIYVKKFLEHNPFLTGPAAELEPVKRTRYCTARLEFPPVESAGHHSDHQFRWELWQTDKERHAVLSSGGKDSLLTYGLLNEMGYDTHPIYINESGRHWFTALNAYNHFKVHVPNTARVWTNCDRVYNWMIRHMPFIRENFNRLRSDEYPIRLWTVAVFLAGALPLLRKRGIARLSVGNEYDTTRRLKYHGITHYDGLYDQSRYFDNAFSRYFMRKGWAISQFSILRPLSEVLIQKILALRYPNLLEKQVSCHAAHKEGDRIVPCGNCEKCRRISAMLTALDVNPAACGYSSTQAAAAVDAYARQGAHHESACVKYILSRLDEKKLLPQDVKTKLKSGRSEAIDLRFDPERSPLDGIPADLRSGLYHIFLQYAGGSLLREGRSWKPFDPLSTPALHRPFPFEISRIKSSPTEIPPEKMLESRFKWGELTWPEAVERLKQVDIALLPVGSIEQHGPHLPLDTDAFDAEYLARKVARACSNPKPLVLPLIPYGVSYEHDDFKGTVSIGNETLAQLVYEIGKSIASNGINKLVIINGHGGNTPALNFAAQKINRGAKIFVCVDSGETSDVDIYKRIHTPNDVHAGEIETSTSLAVRPDLVKMDLAPDAVPQFSSRYLNFTSRRGVSWYGYTRNVSSSGVLGDATRATPEKGRDIWQIMIAHLVALVEDLKGMTLEEIYNRRY